ncbi:hypothetical protein FLACOL_00461 [Flavobacterium columnare]|uniref:Uncharacterized protein n=2 Tax=Flavobacterium TaxID=237 RepID=A0ABW8PP94_9FLAO|nr:hypothetical protein [Flavobacterium columnare]SPE76480.1 hypothetical protein FLACOL_00461 [Flavobacterium columnare]
MKSIKFTISIIILIILFLTIDNALSFYGKGFNFFNNKITYSYNTDFDSLEGFKIEKEGFIQIIGSGTKINNSIEVSKILEYTYNSAGIFCEILDNRNKVIFVKVQYDNKRKPGTRIYYTFVQKSEINKGLKWYKVDNSSFVQLLEILKLVIMFTIAIIIVLLIIHLLNKKQVIKK